LIHPEPSRASTESVVFPPAGSDSRHIAGVGVARGVIGAISPHDPAGTYAAVLDALPIVAFMANPAGQITFVSRGWERFTGTPGHEIIAHGYERVVHPDEFPRVVATWEGACAAGAVYRDEFRLRIGDGSFRWVVSQADPLRGADESIVGWFGTLTDIDELRTVEDGLATALANASASAMAASARSRFVERLLDASDDCVKVLDLDAHLLSMSPNGQKALAILDFATVAGTDWLTFWSGLDRANAEAAVAQARAGGRGRFVGMFAVDGRERWWDVSVTAVLGADGQPEQLLAVSRDVTEPLRAHRELQRSEERYRVLGETLPGITWTATPDGKLDYVSGRPTQNRLPTPDLLGDGWLETVHPDDCAAARARWQAAIAGGVAYDSRFRVRMANGSYRWQLVRGQPQLDENGAVLRWVGVNVDIDDERRADEAREQFVRLVEASDVFIGISDTNGNATYINECGRRLLDMGPMDEARGTNLLAYFMPAERAAVQTEVLDVIAADGRWQGEHRFRNFRTGMAVPVWFTAFSLFDETGTPVGLATVGRDLRERLRLEAGMRALAEAGEAMYVTLDFDGTVKNVARAVTRSFASACTVEVVDDDGGIRSIGAAHRDPELVGVLERAAAARAADPADPADPITRAIFLGESTLQATLAEDWIEASGVGADVAAGLARLDCRSFVFVPIRSAQTGLVIGALTCMLDGDDPRGNYTSEDLRFAQEVAVRAGIALDHARAYERERRIAVSLQTASLPGTLPVHEQIGLTADYRPGKSEATIGGDWYDAFLLDDGRVVITIGDVLGKGLGAAVTMGKLRQAMQSVALVMPDPNTMLDAADRTVRAQSDDTYATALAGILDPARHEFTFASAGHPGPALRHRDGRIEYFDEPGLLLGLRPRGQTQTRTLATPPGATLVFFTDGLIEETRDSDEGHRRLRVAMADPVVTAAGNPARAIVDHVLGGRSASDDIAVLVAHVNYSG
jgi:PAS domain S-box-containing protein